MHFFFFLNFPGTSKQSTTQIFLIQPINIPQIQKISPTKKSKPKLNEHYLFDK